MSLPPADTRTALIEAALFCFAEHGFDGTSIRLIAKRAGRPISLIGHHFGGKDGLYLEVFKSMFQVLPAQEPRPVLPRDRAEAIRLFRERVHSFYGEVCPTQEDQGSKEAGRRLWLLEMSAPRAEIMDLLKERLAPWVEGGRGCLRVLRPDLDENEISFLGSTILSQISGHGLLCGINDAVWGCNQLSPFKSAELICEFVLSGLGVGPQHR